jgi:polyhydroxyalkanoate synthesis regulator phasin
MTIYDDLIKRAEPIVKELIINTKRNIVENGGRWDDRDEEYVRLMTTYKFINAIHTYLLPTDKITYVTYFTKAGNITANVRFKRDDKPMELITQVIYAGGYNIQKLHYRYITNVSPNGTKVVGVQPEVKAIKKKIANLTKLEKIQDDVKKYKERIIKGEEKIERLENKPLKQVFEESDSVKFIYKSFDDIQVGSYNHQNIKTQEDFDAWNLRIVNGIIEKHETDLSFAKDHIDLLKKEVKKLEKKIIKLKEDVKN